MYTRAGKSTHSIASSSRTAGHKPKSLRKSKSAAQLTGTSPTEEDESGLISGLKKLFGKKGKAVVVDCHQTKEIVEAESVSSAGAFLSSRLQSHADPVLASRNNKNKAGTSLGGITQAASRWDPRHEEVIQRHLHRQVGILNKLQRRVGRPAHKWSHEHLLRQAGGRRLGCGLKAVGRVSSRVQRRVLLRECP
jgi:hypothetical protein